jgi:pantothenate kinase-related protein Tda10
VLLQGPIGEAAARRFSRDPQWLSDTAGLPAEALSGLLPWYLPLADHVAALRTAKAGPLCVGIQGPQGAGKSTLTQLLARVLTDVAGLRVAVLSIDDLYLTRSERAELAARVSPLFITRGVPGTHDVALGTRVLGALTRPGSVALPRFDKARDDRSPQPSWPVISGPVDVVLFEGLWIGLTAIDDAELAAPVKTHTAPGAGTQTARCARSTRRCSRTASCSCTSPCPTSRACGAGAVAPSTPCARVSKRRAATRRA